ncbi:DUF1153 domain-containing protein [Paracoccus sp. S-4012]|uniref:CtrA inhibitor SciP n=1 Tax=Paracoccus sp. S-4012 TaxID=2665648 RepID=UPI0012B0B584|nr:DUF1153 domain-containing protein [Paracoccus sp. S-4012]MRX50845.1 DUF1153 domain-containing protein [Paracoccus sp. S-4012]
MFLRRTTAPRAVTLPGGRVLTLADLPPPDTRWVASRKAAVVAAVASGLLTRDEAIACYDLSEEEFDGWAKAFQMHGKSALRITALQRYRQPLIATGDSPCSK